MTKDKTVQIIVNGTRYEWSKNDDITYAQVVTLDVPDYAQHPEITYSVKYKNGHGNKPEGTLSPGGSVKVGIPGS
jgi:Multiubiquitin